MAKATIKTKEEIDKLREGGSILAAIVYRLAEEARPGLTTWDLEKLAEQLVEEYKVKPSFKGFGDPPYPAILCVSNNEGIVHCLPNKEPLKAGDVLGIDCGIWHKGLCTDMAVTVGIGRVSKEAQKLIEVTKKSLNLGLKKVKPGNTLGDIGYAVQTYVEENKMGVVRHLVGHGVGYKVHEEPHIPNFGKKRTGMVLEPGMVLAIEPMVTLGDWNIEVLDNDWDIVTADRSLAAHFEHTVAVTEKGCEILTRLN